MSSTMFFYEYKRMTGYELYIFLKLELKKAFGCRCCQAYLCTYSVFYAFYFLFIVLRSISNSVFELQITVPLLIDFISRKSFD